MDMTLSCPAFSKGTNIQPVHTCVGENRSPELEWSGLPVGTLSVTITLEDPDAPGGTFTHWLVYAIEPAIMKLPGGLPKTPILSEIGMQGMNSFGRIGYDGPCPPPGKAHRYIVSLFALDEMLSIKPGLNIHELSSRMHGHILARAESFGIFRRP